MIAIRRGSDGTYDLYYRHSDGYPTGLGVELIEGLKQHLTIDALLKKVGAEDEKKTVAKPEDAFLEVQGDLEWIYALEHHVASMPDRIYLKIFKTSHGCMGMYDVNKLIAKPLEFAFQVWSSYVQYFPEKPEEAMEAMEHVEMLTDMTLNGIAAFAAAVVRTGFRKAPPETDNIDPKLKSMMTHLTD